MPPSQNPPILAQLRNARTVPEQAAALRALKNDIVGHVQKKEQWITLGVLEPIVRTITPVNPSMKLNGKGSHSQSCTRPLSDEEGAKLQALQLLASFAHGGPAFLNPICAARALPGVMACLPPSTNPPQIVAAALRVLIALADAASRAFSTSPLTLQNLADSVFAPNYLEAFNAILSTSSPKHALQTQVTLACEVIQLLCREEKQQQDLATAGILDSLAARLAGFAVADNYVIPGAAEAAKEDGLLEAFPDSAPSNAKLESVLHAIAAILGESKYRAHRLVCAPAILSVFPPVKFEPLRSGQSARLEMRSSGINDSRSLNLSAMEYVLPAIPVPTSRSASSSASSGTPERSDSQMSNRNSQTKTVHLRLWDTDSARSNAPLDADSDEIESPLIPWLVYLVRTRVDEERLMAASVVTALYKAGLGNKSMREISIGLLVVPILVDMLAKCDKAVPPEQGEMSPVQYLIFEQAPLILSRLIIDCEYLQKAAFDCHAVKVLTKLLRRAYTPSESPDRHVMWSPHADTDMDEERLSPISQLGGAGRDEILEHQIRMRESALKAIGALAAGKEDYRKALVSEDFLPYVVESLSEYPRRPRPSKDKPKDQDSIDNIPTTAVPAYGRNPLSVIVAGCHTVRMLSRSIGILRTAIVDNGIALPIFRFLKHPDINVQNAATATIVNLVVEVSPVREMLTEKGVMQILCEHAHSDNPSLRLNALWALKHFVDAVPPDLKRACLEELESGWLVQLIRDDTQDAALSSSRSRETLGEDMDEDVELPSPEEKHRWLCGKDGEVRELDASQSTRMRQAEDSLAAVRDAETNLARKARTDDLAIQEQGLEFIRNLIGRPGAGSASESPTETTLMIDYLFNELGQDRFFEILESKLKPKRLNPFSRRTPVAGREARIIHPQAQIIVPVIYILVNMAASDTRHRQLVIAQTDLLKLLVQHTGKDKHVRVALCHLVTNLTLQDDGPETEGCRQRAAELRKLGFQNKMEMFKHEDRDLDVRERAKHAVFQMEQASAFSY